jgi:predicted dehydrogenase
VEDLANGLICFENGASLMVDTSFTLHAKKDELSVKLYGDKGGAELEPELFITTERYNTIVNMTPQIDDLTFDFKQAFQSEIDHFIECCLTGNESICPVEDGVEIMKMVDGIYESAQKGTIINFE